MRFGQANLISSTSMGAGTIVTQPMNVQQDWAVAFQATWTGAPQANIKMQGSCDPVLPGLSGSQSAKAVVNYTDLAGTNGSTTGLSSFLYQTSYPGVNWIRMVIVAGTATGILTVNYTSKGV